VAGAAFARKGNGTDRFTGSDKDRGSRGIDSGREEVAFDLLRGSIVRRYIFRNLTNRARHFMSVDNFIEPHAPACADAHHARSIVSPASPSTIDWKNRLNVHDSSFTRFSFGAASFLN